MPTDTIADRSVLMDFTFPVTFSHIVMAYREPQSQDTGWGVLLSPFSPVLLIAVIASFLGVSLLLSLLEGVALLLEGRGRAGQSGGGGGDGGSCGGGGGEDSPWRWLGVLLIVDKVLAVTVGALLAERKEVSLIALFLLSVS